MDDYYTSQRGKFGTDVPYIWPRVLPNKIKQSLRLSCKVSAFAFRERGTKYKTPVFWVYVGHLLLRKNLSLFDRTMDLRRILESLSGRVQKQAFQKV